MYRRNLGRHPLFVRLCPGRDVLRILVVNSSERQRGLKWASGCKSSESDEKKRPFLRLDEASDRQAFESETDSFRFATRIELQDP